MQLIIEGISNKDKTGHLFVVDLMFDFKRSTARQLLFNEIYTPVFEKKKILPPSKRSAFQLLDAMRVNDMGVLNAFKATAKTHSTMDKKIFIPLYAEHLHFLVKRCGWLVTKIYSHFTFEQAMFKKQSVIMKQVSRENAKTSVERDYFTVMNNSNFGYDCRNNIDNYFFSPIIDEIEDVHYIRRHQNDFDPFLQNFVSSDLLEKEINEGFDNKIAAFEINSQFYDAKKNPFKIEINKQLNAVNSMGNKKRRRHKKDSVQEVDERIATTIHKIFETNSSFHVKQHIMGKVQFLFFSSFLLVLTKYSFWE